MPILSTDLAAGVGVSATNKQFGIPSEELPRKVVFVATFDPLKTSVVPNVPIQVFSAEDVGNRGEFGFMAHRMASRIFEAGNLETWWIPQDEVAGAQATGTITITATSAKAGTLAFYVGGIRVPVAVAAGDNGDAIATALAAAITAIKELPITAVVNGVTTNQVDITAKTTGTWGNDYTLEFDLEPSDEQPADITSIVVVDMSGGTGIPDIQTALDSLGIDDAQNEKNFTLFLHGYGQDTTTLDKISTYNGIGNDTIGNWDDLVGRPWRSGVGDSDPGSAALTALIAIGDARTDDRTNTILGMPDIKEHPDEIFALIAAKCEIVTAQRTPQNYIDIQVPGIHVGDSANRWTDSRTNRDSAVKAGISTTQVKNGILTIQNMVTFYHPANVPVNSNGFRDWVHHPKYQNMLYLTRQNFESERWQGVFIVTDTAFVSDPNAREKARDISAVEGDLLALIDVFAGKGYLYDPQFSKDKIAAGGSVVLRPGGNGFTNKLQIIPSGAGGIMDTDIEFDTNLAVTVNTGA